MILRLSAPIDLDPVGAPAWMASHDHSLLDYYDQVHPSAQGHVKLGALLAETLEPLLSP